MSSSRPPPLIEEILAADKRVRGLVAFVPFFGAWLIWRSPAHTRVEKRRLSWIAIGLTVLESVAVILLLPSRADEAARVRNRIDAQIQTLGNIVKEYGEKNGAFPDTGTWERSTKEGDQKFFDPWGRRYRYEPTAGGVTIRTLGRDGAEGGTGEDADVAASFASPPSPTQALAPSSLGNPSTSAASTTTTRPREPSARRDRIESDLAALSDKFEELGKQDPSSAGGGMAERRDVLFRMLGLYYDWDDLKKEATKANGGRTPSWWRDEISCNGCLGRSAVEAALAALSNRREPSQGRV